MISNLFSILKRICSNGVFFLFFFFKKKGVFGTKELLGSFRLVKNQEQGLNEDQTKNHYV